MKMFLYRLEASGQGFPASQVVVVAEDEEQAFQAAESLLERNALGLIQIKDMAIVEKKRVDKGSGYVLEPTEEEKR